MTGQTSPTRGEALKISVDLTEDEAKLLGAAADRMGLKPERLVRAVLSDFLGQTRDDFQRTGEWIMRQNKDLYRRCN